jgi:hypothetical protein
MSSREFVDSAGERWLVWDTRPTTRVRLNPAFEAGWLTFESGRQLRRLAPTPDGWESFPDHELERLCRSAPVVERRRTGPSVTRIDALPEHRDELRP